MASYEDYSREELIRLLKDRDRRDATRFGLVWETNAVERERALNDDFVALDLDTDLSTPLTETEDGWKNLIIEGDNFDALRFLRMAYAGRVKCICIDPPYNTGNRDFVYNDRFVDKDDAWRHSRWCEFMHQRLTLAKELLAEDGVIFVHIDDNEVHHLGLLMAQVFGETNWICTMVWQKSYGGGSKAKHIVGLHEYVFAYAFNKESIARFELPPDPETRKYYKFSDDKFESRGPYRTQPLATNSMDARPNLRYPIPFEGEEIWPEKQWQWAQERTMAALENDELVITRAKGKGKTAGTSGWTVNYKQYLRGDSGEERGAKPYSIFQGPFTQEGTAEIKDLFGEGKAFSFPKPTGLMQKLLQIGCGQDDIVVDFFAGSGTTAHAVLKQNAADGGNRRFILVSSTEATEEEPEKNLCRDVCAERVRRVIGGYGERAGVGGDFAYLKTRRIPEGSLTEIEHSQVWTALQLIHRERLTAYADAALHWVEDEDGALAYVPRVKQTTATEILKRAKSLPGVIVYTWQPGLLAPRLAKAGHIQVETIPQSLARKFGLGRSR